MKTKVSEYMNENGTRTTIYEDSYGFMYEYLSDNKGITFKEICKTSKTPHEFIYEFTYDKNGNALTYKYSDGYSWERTYDENGRIITYKDSTGYSWERTYDEKGNVIYKNSDGEIHYHEIFL